MSGRQQSQSSGSGNNANAANNQPYVGDAKYTPAETSYLNKQPDGEYHFLARHELSIPNENDRADGRAIVRGHMEMGRVTKKDK